MGAAVAEIQQESRGIRKRYAIVGAGARHAMFRDAILRDYSARAELVAICDANPGRARLSASAAAEHGQTVAIYAADAFDRMLAEQRPDSVIVCTPDHLHDEFMVRAMRAGCDVITEKPMTIDIEKLERIVRAQRETGRSVTVTFNYRYSPARTQVKHLLMEGAIGDITAVDFRWHLDRVHGADYFRRWHRYKSLSGGLLVHKSTHHFDLLNWWIGAAPALVRATGRRAFYTPQTASALGLEPRGPRCLTCNSAPKCDFRLNIEADGKLRPLYLESEAADGYLRDRCVFDDDITIEDTMQVQVDYANAVSLNYSLVAYSPWEGLEVVFHGTKGELRHKTVEVHGVFGGKRSKPTADATTTEIHRAGEAPYQVDVWHGAGGHGGADPVMLGYIFDPQGMEPDRYARSSNHQAGAMSILTGIAANQSIRQGEIVQIASLAERAGLSI